MEWIETTGKTVAEARELALDQLGVHESEAEFEIVEEPKEGLFRRTRGIARVRARVIPKAPRPKNERKRRPKKSGSASTDSNRNAPSGVGPTAKAERPADGGNANKKQGRPAKASGQRKETVSESNAAKASANANNDKEQSGDNGRNGGRSQREPMADAEQIRVVEEFLNGLLQAFGMEATLETTIVDKDLVVNIVGEGLGLLVGPRLATLDALQEVTRLALQREADGKEYARVGVDVAGIRQARRDSLDEFVRSASELVRNEGKTVVFEEMSSVDRKQVHDLASAIEGVKSISEGEDPRRRVALVPAD